MLPIEARSEMVNVLGSAIIQCLCLLDSLELAKWAMGNGVSRGSLRANKITCERHLTSSDRRAVTVLVVHGAVDEGATMQQLSSASTSSLSSAVEQLVYFADGH